MGDGYNPGMLYEHSKYLNKTYIVPTTWRTIFSGFWEQTSLPAPPPHTHTLFFSFSFCHTVDQTQEFTHAKQEFYHWHAFPIPNAYILNLSFGLSILLLWRGTMAKPPFLKERNLIGGLLTFRRVSSLSSRQKADRHGACWSSSWKFYILIHRQRAEWEDTGPAMWVWNLKVQP